MSPQPPYVIGIDSGTQSLRSGIFDLEGNPVVFATYEYPTYFPKPGWAEQEAADWWTATVATVRACLERSGVNPADIIGISVDGTSSTVVPVTEDGTPLCRAILWMDSRAHRQVETIAASRHPVLKYVGGQDAVEWMVPKALWLKESEPEVYHKAARIVESTDWLTWKLSGEWTASVCNATCKWNYVHSEGGWNAEFLSAVGLDDILAKWPQRVLFMGDQVGRLTPAAAAELGLPGGIAVGQSGVDAHAAMFGLNVVRPGRLALIIGSSTVHLALSSEPVYDPGIWGPYPEAVVRGAWLIEGGQVSSGSVISWLRKNFAYREECEAKEQGKNVFELLDAKAAALPPGAEGLVMLDYFQGNRTPLRDPLARGMIWGLSLKHGLAHLLRAAYEGTAFGTRHILDTFAASNFHVQEIYACGGGTKSQLWLKIHADVSGVPIYLTKVGEASTLGTAVCAAVAAGAYRNVEEAAGKMVTITDRIEPDPEAHAAYEFFYRQYVAGYPRMKELMHELVHHVEGA